MSIVPLVVTGLPVIDKAVPPVNPTDVTVPVVLEYSGIFKVPALNVAAPLVPVVVNVIASCLALKVLKSEAVNTPVAAPLASPIEILGVVVGFVIVINA